MNGLINRWFAGASTVVGRWCGSSWAFIGASGALVVWLAAGPFNGFSDTWQLWANTATTIVTYLLLFLVQNTQLRSDEAMQLKLDHIIVKLRETDSRLAGTERLTVEELEVLHEQVLPEQQSRGE